jgi:hypothetical protein
MNTNILKDMLLISDPSVFKMYKELITIAGYFVAPVFTIALVIEYLSDMNFAEVLKKLLIVVVFMGSFYGIHTKAVDISLRTATKTLKRISPRNLFIKKWYMPKVRTKDKKSWGSFKSLLIPNINDIVATFFFVLSKMFIWFLKLIYSSVYHLTYVFAGYTAILYFLGWTKDALKGTIQASLWCMILPFVVVAILALVGNSMSGNALVGNAAFSSIDNLVWLFGVTLLLLMSPLITYGMIKGDGIHSAGAKMGLMLVNSGTHAMTMLPMISRFGNTSKSTNRLGRNGVNKVSDKLNNFRDKSSKFQFDKSSSNNNQFATNNKQSKLETSKVAQSDSKTLSRDNSNNSSIKHTSNFEANRSQSQVNTKEHKTNTNKKNFKQSSFKSSNTDRRFNKVSSNKVTINKNLIKSSPVKNIKGGKREL